jgi:hypothetical protein
MLFMIVKTGTPSHGRLEKKKRRTTPSARNTTNPRPKAEKPRT